MSGFESPNYTQTPNDFFAMIPDMTEAELRVTLVMIRRTFGFHRNDFKMGIRKLATAAGLSPQGARDGAEAAEKRGTFRRSNPDGQGEAEWELVVPLQPVDPPLNPVDSPPPASRGQVGSKESNKENIKKDLVDAVIEFQIKPKAIQDAMRDYFKLTPNWEKKEPREFMQWAMGEKVTAEQIEFAANVYRSDKRFNWKIPDLKGIAEHWLELIESYRPKQEPTQPESDGGFRV